jgi:putative ABC transport system permease protein
MFSESEKISFREVNMGILIKYTLLNIKEHKFRTFLIVLSIMLSVGLFFSSLSISDALTEIIMENIRSQIGTAEIVISPGKFNSSGLLKKEPLGEASELIDYTLGVVENRVSYQNIDDQTDQINLKGYRLEDLQRINPVTYDQKLDGTSFTGKSLIISKAYAEEQNLELGDFIKLEFSPEDYKYFQIYALANNKGFFKNTPSFGQSEINFVAPRETLSRFIGTPEQVNTIYAKTIDDRKVDESIEALQSIYEREQVNKMVTKTEIDAQIRPIRIPFMFMLILVVIISIFIIYTSFKVITLERLPMLGTFRSIGATKKMTDFIMLGEAIIYGILGSLSGVFIGHHLLSAVMKLIANDMGTMVLRYPKINVIIALIFGLILSIGSALVPIIKTSKIPVKEILLNIIDGTKKKRKHSRYIIGSVLGILSIVLPMQLNEGNMAAIAGGLGIIFMIGALVCFIPLLANLFIQVTERLFGLIFGNIGRIAVKNMRGNRSTQDNIILLTIGLASVLTILVIGSGIQNETSRYYDEQNYEVSIRSSEASRVTAQRIMSIEEIDEAYLYQRAWNAFKYGDEDKPFIRSLVGIESSNFLEFFNYDILNTSNDQEIIEELLIGRKLILSTVIRDEYDFKIGDQVSLDTGNGIRTYEIIGFTDVKENNGQFGMTSMYNLKNDLKHYWGLNMAVKIKPGVNTTGVKEKVEKKLEHFNWYQVDTIQEMRQQNLDNNNQIIVILSVFSAATALIGSIGVMNNFLVSLLARRKSLAIYASIGMSKVQRRRMILIESISSGVIGALFGIVTAQLIMLRITSLLSQISIPLVLKISLLSGIVGFVGSVMVCLLSSISVLSQLRKLNIIKELRYE